MIEKYFPKNGALSKDMIAYSKKRVPIRPLGPLSDLVIEELPGVLAQAKDGRNVEAKELLERANHFAEGLLMGGLPTSSETQEYRIARLDVLMLYTGFAHRGVRLTSNLSDLVGRFSGAQIPALTYEDIVLNNPVHTDPRTFTDGVVGADEEHFYVIHQDLEHAMKPAIVALKDAIFVHIKSAKDFSRDEALQKKAVADTELLALDLLVDNTRTVGRGMKLFDEFRPFLNPIPKDYLAPTLSNEEYVGPSGAYSGTVHALDLLIEGSAFGKLASEDEVLLYVKTNKQYIPIVDSDLLDEAISLATRDNNILHVRDSQDKMLVDTLADYASRLLMFRRIHLGSVRRQVPSVMKNDSEIGTGGISNVARFLQGRIERTEAALKRFEEMSQELDYRKIRDQF